MELVLKRQFFFTDATIGKLYADGDFLCYILEDKDRDANRDGDLNDTGEQKVYAQTAIPYGRYNVTLSYSPKFKKVLPEVLHVPHFTGIRFHPGNDIGDTAGCLLPGRYISGKKVLNSTDAHNELMGLLQACIDTRQKIYLTVTAADHV